MNQFLKKNDLTIQKVQKNGPFLQFFLIFSKMVHKTWLVSVDLNSRDHDTPHPLRSNWANNSCDLGTAE